MSDLLYIWRGRTADHDVNLFVPARYKFWTWNLPHKYIWFNLINKGENIILIRLQHSQQVPLFRNVQQQAAMGKLL